MDIRGDDLFQQVLEEVDTFIVDSSKVNAWSRRLIWEYSLRACDDSRVKASAGCEIVAWDSINDDTYKEYLKFIKCIRL